MARSGDITQRISIEGDDEIRRRLSDLARSGEQALGQLGQAASASTTGFSQVSTAADEMARHLAQLNQTSAAAGNQVRAALASATAGAGGFSSAAQTAGASSGQLRFALQNLTFQVNDVATSLASGGSAFRVFAQQGGQIVQAFQQGGGIGPVLRAAGSAIANMVTPMRLAAVGATALGVEFAAVIARAAASQGAVREFDVILSGVARNSRVTGKDLEEAAHSLRDVGLSAAEARPLLQKFLQEGGRPELSKQVVRIGAELKSVLGEGAMQQFIQAAAQGGPALEEFAKKLGIIPKVAADAQAALKPLSDSTSQTTRSIEEQLRSSARQIADLTRERGTREQEIVRETNIAINDLLLQRSRENAARLAEYNQQIEAAAQQAAATGQSLLNQIEAAVSGAHQRALSPFATAIEQMATAWSTLQDTIANSAAIQQVIVDLTNMARSISDTIQWVDKLIEALKSVPGLPASLGGSGGGGNISGNASGGLIRGPGTGTSDSILMRASAGEYIVRAAAVSHYGPGLLEALNRMALPMRWFSAGGLVDSLNESLRSPLRFASGGMVPAVAPAAASGGTPVHIHIGGRSFPVMADQHVARALSREAGRAALTQIGPAPSWSR